MFRFRSNKAYWVDKINGNIKRDRRNRSRLRTLGWKVVRFWESDIRKDPYKIGLGIIRGLRLRDSDSRRLKTSARIYRSPAKTK
jgi:G:T-mismatch repair DNA endonuclease (very short patch repair protein)